MSKKIDTNHADRSHALLSASGSKRWLNCTPSVRLEERLNKADVASVYAQEGTLAHEFADLELRKFNKEISNYKYKKEIKVLQSHELYTKEMQPQVAKYVDYVKEQYAIYKANGGVQLLVEKRLDFSDYVEDGFGTGDTLLISDGILEVADLKYGKGVRVEAENNPQLMLYGLGALKFSELFFEVHTVRLTIHQPRLNSVSTFDMSIEALLWWALNEVKPKAKKAFAGEGVYKVGDWCRWCKAKAQCRAFAEYNLELTKYEFADGDTLNEEELLAAYSQLDQLESWGKALRGYLLSEALKGRNFEGYKLVAGRSNRKWTDPEKIAEVLQKEGFAFSDIHTSKLNGIGKIADLMSADKFEEILSDFIEKPLGKPTFVPISDKRPPYDVSSAEDDFK